MNLGMLLTSAAAAVSLIGLLTLGSSYVRMRVGRRRRRRRQPRDPPLRALSALVAVLGTAAIAGIPSALLLVAPLLGRSGR
jgi:hypothetical protein